MSRRALWIGVVGLLLAAVSLGSLRTAHAGGAGKEDYAALEGVWSYASVVVDGTQRPDPPFESNKLVIRKDGRFLIQQNSRVTRGTFQLDTSVTPHRLDATFADGPTQGRSFAGIYELNGDTARFCAPIRATERPIAFESKAGGGTVLQVWKREKPGVSETALSIGRQELAGGWQAVACKLDGADVGEADLKKLRLTFGDNGKLTVFNDGQVLLAGASLVDPLFSPMTLDVTYIEGDDKGKSALAIYRIEGDTLTICNAEPDKPRPADFTAAEGSDRILSTFRRESK